MTTNGSSQSSSTLLLTTVKWGVENDLFLADFIQRCALPHLALVTKGQYLTVGAPNVASPQLKPYVLIHSTHKVRKVLAQLVRVKEGKKKTLTEQKVSIPESYSGHFEILSEDGRPAVAITSVEELAHRNPEMFLVRQNCKAYLPDPDGELRSLYRTRSLHEGEKMIICGRFNFKKIGFLRCFDDLGHSVYLKLSQKGKFSPVARPDSITGVHTIENLMSKRLPLTVRLIQGTHPPELLKAAGNGPIVLQLQTVFHEDLVLVHSLQREQGQFLAVPLNAHLKLAPALNHPQVRSRSEFQKLCTRCEDVLTDFFDRMTVFNDHQFVYDTGTTTTTTDQNGHGHRLEDYGGGTGGGGGGVTAENNDDHENGHAHHSEEGQVVSDEEIEQLYDYIRGLAPLPNSHHVPRASRARGSPPIDYKPLPPPIETIPSRKSGDSSNSRGTTSPMPVAIIDKRPPSSPPPRARSPLVEPIGKPHHHHHQHSSTSPSNTGSPKGTVFATTDKRLDDALGYGRMPTSPGRQRKLSKSSDKLTSSSSTPYAGIGMGASSYSRFYNGTHNGTSNNSNGTSNNNNTTHSTQNLNAHFGALTAAEEPAIIARRTTGSPSTGGSNLKRRPMSMVIPDNMNLLPRPSMNMAPIMYSASHIPQDYYQGGFRGPGALIPFQPHPMHPIYHSFMNLNVLDEKLDGPPPYSAASPTFPVATMTPPAPPPYGFPSNVFPRYAPRYQYQPVYRV